MSKKRKLVILCRGERTDTCRDYTTCLETAGFVCKHLAVLRFEFTNLQRLRDCLVQPDSYAGLIVTSQRAVEAIGLAIKEGENVLARGWNDRPATYCVGAATALLAETELRLKNCLGSECGNGRQLVDRIVDDCATRCLDARRPLLLYPCSAIAPDTIQRLLTDRGINVDRVPVYETLPVETLEKDLSRILAESPEMFVFFSPSTVEYTINAARDRANFLENIRAVAIGPVTADALVRAGIVVHAVSTKPEPEALLRAIESAEL